jgi:hypothetical protein
MLELLMHRRIGDIMLLSFASSIPHAVDEVLHCYPLCLVGHLPHKFEVQFVLEFSFVFFEWHKQVVLLTTFEAELLVLAVRYLLK